jgi:hypothetical protein
MSERPSFWQRLFGGAASSSLSPRQQKVSDYIIGRMENDVPLQQVPREDYVRRKCSQAEVEQIVSTRSSSRPQGYASESLSARRSPNSKSATNFAELPLCWTLAICKRKG